MLRLINSRTLLGYRFIGLVSSQVLSQLGNNFFSLALLWYVLKETGSRSDVAIMAMLQVIPNAFSLFAGTLADRMNRWTLMIGTDISRFLIVVTIAILGFTNSLSIWALGGMVILLQLVGTFFTPAEMAAFPTLVTEEQLPLANGINQALTMTSQLAGMALGGLLLALLGPFRLISLNSVTFLISFLSLLLIRPWKRRDLVIERADLSDKSREEKFETNFTQDWKIGIQSVAKQKTLRMIIPVAVIVNFALAPIMSLDAPWIKQILHLHSTQYGLVGASMMFGVVLGNLIVNLLHKIISFHRLLPIGLAIMATAVIILSQIPLFLVTIICMVCLGTAAGVINTAMFTLIQRITPSQLLGRVSGIMFSFTTISLPVGMGVGSALALHMSISTIFTGGGILAGIGAILAFTIPQVDLKSDNLSVTEETL